MPEPDYSQVVVRDIPISGVGVIARHAFGTRPPKTLWEWLWWCVVRREAGVPFCISIPIPEIAEDKDELS